jgi:putative ABC transport system permease protein
MASVLGWPVEKLAGFSGRLARENAVRQPARTAGTAAALMIGVALVTFAAIFAAGAKATIEDAVKSNFKGAFVVQSTDGFSPFTASAMREIAKVDGVGKTSPIRFSRAKVGTQSGTTAVTGLDPATFPSLYTVTVKQGPANAVSLLADPGLVAVSKGYAEKHHTKVGEVLQVRTEAVRKLPLKVVGVLEDKGGLIADLTVSNAVVGAKFGEPKDGFGLIGLAPGADAKAVQARIKVVTKDKYPQIEVKTAQKFVDDQAGQVDQLLGLIYALLSLAIVVSLFGIVNTLILSISERTRELGLLRAVGASRRQVRRMIRWEAVITSMIGGVLGCALGVVLAVLFTRPLDDFKLTIPFGSIVFLVILSGIAGVLAASFPARRASKLDVLDALAYE